MSSSGAGQQLQDCVAAAAEQSQADTKAKAEALLGTLLEGIHLACCLLSVKAHDCLAAI
jgi:hypothetical protein